jgi:hypothetical protein
LHGASKKSLEFQDPMSPKVVGGKEPTPSMPFGNGALFGVLIADCALLIDKRSYSDSGTSGVAYA